MQQVAPDMFLVSRVFFYSPSKQQLTPGLYRKVGDKMQRIEPGSILAAKGGARRRSVKNKRRSATNKRRSATNKHRARTQKKRSTRK